MGVGDTGSMFQAPGRPCEPAVNTINTVNKKKKEAKKKNYDYDSSTLPETMTFLLSCNTNHILLTCPPQVVNI